MTSRLMRDGALRDRDARAWEAIDWRHARRQVRRLQVRIAQAVKEDRYGRARALQRILTRSFYAKALAVKRVTSNKGKNTPGVDGVLWRDARRKMQAILSLHSHGYRPQPLRRIYIPKKNGKKRPLGIPTIHDRAMQALYKLALAPVAEMTADPNSYGFREARSCHDAVGAAWLALSKFNSAPWVLEGDIAGCYDNISHQWMLEHIAMDTTILRKWLAAGYVEHGITYPSHKGTPQGGVISPTLANMTLDGLEAVVRAAAPRRSRVNFIRYADDFIVTGKSRRILETMVRPAIEEFLAERGLELSSEKTAITHVRDGFVFLGQHFRKHGDTLHITPAKEGVLALVRKLGETIRRHVSVPMPALIRSVNRMLRGWANYHRYVLASDAFSRVTNYLYHQLWRMLHRRHPKKRRRWLVRKYWTATGRKWVFSVWHRTTRGVKLYQIVKLWDIELRWYRKVKAEANPYMPEHAQYFRWRRHTPEARTYGPTRRRNVRARPDRGDTAGPPNRGDLSKCLSRMTGNCHVRF